MKISLPYTRTRRRRKCPAASRKEEVCCGKSGWEASKIVAWLHTRCSRAWAGPTAPNKYTPPSLPSIQMMKGQTGVQLPNPQAYPRWELPRTPSLTTHAGTPA